LLRDNGLLLVYGPFNYNGFYTSQSNAQFDKQLKLGNPARGIRDFEEINAQAAAASFRLIEDYEMPSNNRLLVWKLSSRCEFD
jgi:hypothetical protein